MNLELTLAERGRAGSAARMDSITTTTRGRTTPTRRPGPSCPASGTSPSRARATPQRSSTTSCTSLAAVALMARTSRTSPRSRSPVRCLELELRDPELTFWTLDARRPALVHVPEHGACPVRSLRACDGDLAEQGLRSRRRVVHLGPRGRPILRARPRHQCASPLPLMSASR